MSLRITIPLSGLREGQHSFEYKIDKEFFEQFEESEIEEGDLEAIVILGKRGSQIDLMIKISGRVTLSCDRCLELYSQEIGCENRVIVKIGEKVEDIDPDIISVPYDQHEVDLRDHIYEFIHLALPARRVHPDDPMGKSTCNPAMLKKLEQYSVNGKKENINNERKSDSRWDELKKLTKDN